MKNVGHLIPGPVLYYDVRAEAKRVGGDQDQVVALIRGGASAEAAALCVRLHTATIGRLCMAMLGDQAEAEDAVQETFLSAHRAIHQLRGDSGARAWLITIARHICARRLATRTRRAQRLVLVHDADGDAAGPQELAERRRRAIAVRAALERLKPSEREIVLLRYQAELSFREVVEVSGLEPATARKRISRALRRLRTLLRNEVEP